MAVRLLILVRESLHSESFYMSGLVGNSLGLGIGTLSLERDYRLQ